ncbi:universal stress protein [Flavobacteriaceae bacterium AU392]|nr:universal stress protein [Flavobacteriaceae bacterium]RKM85931.1 universal stress protein [Flavobacteriaceae bacterium AU392]
MKNIVLLTDFSENSQNAINYALEFFKNDTCQFYVMHVHKMGSYTMDDLMLAPDQNVYDSIVKKPKKRLNEIIQNLENIKKTNHKFETIVDFDDFTDAINQIVVSKKIDFVVLGSNGVTGAKEVLFGSNTLNVIRKVNCKTLVVPKQYIYQPIKGAVLALDSSDDVTDIIVSQLKSFMITHPFLLNVLRINPHQNKTEYTFYDHSYLEKIPHRYYTINDVPTHYAINSFIQIKNIGMSILFINKEGFFERLFSSSAKTKISNSLKTPLLIFHNKI